MDPVTATIVVALIAATPASLSLLVTHRQNKKLDETHKQVTQNSHQNDPPTVIDLLDDIKSQVTSLDNRVSTLETKVQGDARRSKD